MTDQANRLRSMIEARNENKNETQNAENEFKPMTPPSMSARVITVTSGKGGVGKTNFTVNLAIHLRRQNKRVVIIDADFGLANIEILFGVIPKYTLSDVLLGDKTMEEVMALGPLDIRFISGGSGLGKLANLTERQMEYILENFGFLDSFADVVLIDTGAGISRSVVNFIKASQETVLLTTPEPTSITDAYAIIKTVKEDRNFIPEFKIVVNRVDEVNEGKDIYEKLNMVSEKFLDIRLKSLGSIPNDSHLIKAVKRQEPALLCFPQSAYAKSIETIGYRLLDMDAQKDPKRDGIKSFMKRLAGILGG